MQRPDKEFKIGATPASGPRADTAMLSPLLKESLQMSGLQS
jgi:hypothetical protein